MPILQPFFHTSYYYDYDNYFQLISELFLPDETIINFNLPLYSKYTDDVSNFQDSVHLSRKGAEIFSQEFASQIDSLLK